MWDHEGSFSWLLATKFEWWRGDGDRIEDADTSPRHRRSSTKLYLSGNPWW